MCYPCIPCPQLHAVSPKTIVVYGDPNGAQSNTLQLCCILFFVGFFLPFFCFQSLSYEARLPSISSCQMKLQAELLAVTENLQQQTNDKMRLRQEISEKDEELECLESQFSTQCSISEVRKWSLFVSLI